MDRLPGASALARALLSLSRGRATGVLEVVADIRLGRLAIRDGHTIAATVSEPDAECLGDLLVRRGVLDPLRHREALDVSEPVGPVGAWLVREGLISEGDLRDGLFTQLRARVRRIFEWDQAEFRFTATAPEVGVPSLDVPLPTQDLVLDAMRAQVAPMPLVLVRRRLGHGLYVLTSLGEEVVRDATLEREEADAAAAPGWCERGLAPGRGRRSRTCASRAARAQAPRGSIGTCDGDELRPALAQAPRGRAIGVVACAPRPRRRCRSFHGAPRAP